MVSLVPLAGENAEKKDGEVAVESPAGDNACCDDLVAHRAFSVGNGGMTVKVGVARYGDRGALTARALGRIVQVVMTAQAIASTSSFVAQAAVSVAVPSKRLR